MDKLINNYTLEVTDTLPPQIVTTQYNIDSLIIQRDVAQAEADRLNDLIDRATKVGFVLQNITPPQNG